MNMKQSFARNRATAYFEASNKVSGPSRVNYLRLALGQINRMKPGCERAEGVSLCFRALNHARSRKALGTWYEGRRAA